MFRKALIIILVIAIPAILLPACSNRLSQAEQEVAQFKLELAELEKDIQLQEEELQDHDILTRNLNRLLKTVYYGSAVPIGEGGEKNFTAFTMYYKENFYLITAGHCIEYDDIRYTDFSFKSNGRKSRIYPKLLYYEADYEDNRDFAIFNHPSLTQGLMVEEDDMEPRYVLGNIERKLNFFKEFDTAREGESGSPILSRGCKLVGIVIKNNSDYTPISEVTTAIDRLLEE